ncbi:hypothetical protein [Natrialba aegyptia]|uniref:Uncharacterized protein n=1 Tax=Natrialba aegyptia DSM 13077 TaxID=1227491 RepID=M0B8I6_9EURY|nr:hypothetical protein [Natrialba aegyptia]ELZ06817.1 hypothetical protein C480_07297 [Natrialba aegyptia DSM 13077]
MSNGNSGTRRYFLKTAAVGSATVPLVGTAIASEGETERKRDVSGYSLSARGSGETTGDTISKEERERIRTLMTEIGDGDSTQTLQRSRKTSDEASSMESETVDILQEDPTDDPENQVWSESTSVSDTTVTGASLVDADYYMTCYKPAIYDEDGNRYLMWYAWGGLRPQDRAAWTGNLENARVEIELTSDNGDMVRYKPAVTETDTTTKWTCRWKSPENPSVSAVQPRSRVRSRSGVGPSVLTDRRWIRVRTRSVRRSKGRPRPRVNC